MDRRGPLRRQFENDVSLTATTVLAVADASGRDPQDLPPLGATVDCSGLESLHARDAPRLAVSFEYAGFDVTIRSDVVEVRALES